MVEVEGPWVCRAARRVRNSPCTGPAHALCGPPGTCPRCHGSGWYEGDDCRTCRGRGSK